MTCDNQGNVSNPEKHQLLLLLLLPQVRVGGEVGGGGPGGGEGDVGADGGKVQQSTVVACRALPPEALRAAEAGRGQDQNCQQVHQTGSLISAKYESYMAERWFWNKLQNLEDALVEQRC